MIDETFIRRTLTLARRAEGKTSPNPMVGAVLVRNGIIISEGYHKKAGTAHAEVIAIEKAGLAAAGSTLYVSLEPCCHKDKRTPPCTEKIITSKIRKVVIGMLDPNPKVSGKGMEQLRKAGLEVVPNILDRESRKLNEIYIRHITGRVPFVILKVAMTLDGKIATPEGESKWITGEAARRDVHRLRGKVDAIMTAIGTVRADDPLLTCRIGKMKSPVRVIVDPGLTIDPRARILSCPPQSVLVARKSSDPKKKEALEQRGILFIEHSEERPDMQKLAKELYERMGITSLLVEGGSSLNSSCLEAGIVDKVIFYIAPKIIGGKESFPAVGGRAFKPLGEAHQLKEATIRRTGQDFVIEGYLREI
jgi:diaminohydroxyphosphoribosylaminopyrimidine deaminase/5-amino-6-(5-phosphoribosylamino)uracil reductase